MHERTSPSVVGSPDVRHLIHQPSPHQYVLGAYATAITTDHPGETVAIQTTDCFGGRVTREDPTPSAVLGDAPLNPLTGSIYVEGAEPGAIPDLSATKAFAVVSFQRADVQGTSAILTVDGQ